MGKKGIDWETYDDLQNAATLYLGNLKVLAEAAFKESNGCLIAVIEDYCEFALGKIEAICKKGESQ